MDGPLFDENTFLGIRVNAMVFWIAFTFMLVLFTSPAVYLPLIFGYGPVAAATAGVVALSLNVAVPLLIARRTRTSD